MDSATYILCKSYVKNALNGVKGENCTIKSIVHQNGVNTVTFEWTDNSGEKQESIMSVKDGTPIATWSSGVSYECDDIVLYENNFYICVIANNDEEFDSAKWRKIGNTGEGGTDDYSDLKNKPSINGVILSGNKNTSELGILDALAEVATTGSYNDLSDTPVVDSTLSATSTNAIQNKAVYAGLAGKVDKVDDMGLSQNSFTNDEKAKLANLENYDDTGVKKALAEIVDSGSKNLLINIGTTQTSNGVNFTVNDDGSVIVNGTATANTFFTINRNIVLSERAYTVSGCPAGGSTSISYALMIYINDGGVAGADAGTGDTFTGDVAKTYRCQIRIASGYTANNLIFYPMICTADKYAISPDFQPYVPSSAELAENKVDIPKIISATITESDAENYSDGTVCGYANNFADGMGAWVVIRTYTLNVDKTRKIQIAETSAGVRKTRLYNGEWNSWI